MSATRQPRGAVRFGQIAAKLVDPVTRKRGFAKVDLIASWDDVVGPRYAEVTQPAKLTWRRDGAGGAVLTVRVSGPSAVFLQHESEAFIARINTFLGFQAVSELRIVQQPLTRPRTSTPPPPELSERDAIAIDHQVADIEDDGLRAAVARLGKAIARDRLARA